MHACTPTLMHACILRHTIIIYTTYMHACIYTHTRTHNTYMRSYTLTLRNKVRSAEGQITLTAMEEEEKRERGKEVGKEEKEATVSN